MNYGTITTGKPQWLREVEAQRQPIVLGGITYQERDLGTRQCLTVRDYANLIDCAEDFNELLCMSDPDGIFVDLGDAPKGHDLIISAEGGKVYVNGYPFRGVAGIQSLGDGSWGIAFEDCPPEYPEGILGWLIKVYDVWLDEVYKRCIHLGLVESNWLHNKSILHLIRDDLPKGKIISKLVLDKQYTS